LAGQRRRRSPFEVTILFVPASSGPEQLAANWADDCDQIIIRLCPICKRDSIVGHGRRRKQAHDEHHDWIGIRRGRCIKCGRTFTFLPLFSLPYTHYSLVARCQALQRRFVEHCSWEKSSVEVQGCGSRAGFLHGSPLVEGFGLFSAGTFVSAPHFSSRGSLAEAW
jgi:hypothetical protein